MSTGEVKNNVVETDVLVLGGGIAGCMAVLQAKKVNPDANVVLVDRGFVGKTGQSAFFSGFLAVFNEEWGHDFDSWKNSIVYFGEYLNDRKWVDILIKDSYAVFQDFEEYGVPFIRNEDGTPRRTMFACIDACQVQMQSRNVMSHFRKKAKEKKVKIFDHISVTDLIKQNGSVVGAVGFNRISGDFYTFIAKATIATMGNALFKNYVYSNSSTGSGQAMGYRAGAELISMEADGKRAIWVKNPDTIKFQSATVSGRFVNQMGEQFIDQYTSAYGGEVYGHKDFAIAFEVERGHAPIYMDFGTMSDEQKKLRDEGFYERLTQTTPRQVERAGVKPEGRVEYYVPYGGTGENGGLRVGHKCETTLPGLYAGGDTVGNNVLGAGYSAGGLAFTNAALTGRRAGQFAAEYALKIKKPVVDEKEIARLKEIAYAPIKREGGFRPPWLLQRIQWLIAPFDVLFFKHERSMQAALLMMEEMRDYFIPKLWAEDYHQLANAHDIRDIVICTEAMLRASLFRTESRGGHLRTNYLFRDDKNWLAWVVCKEEDGKMKLWKEPLPKEYWPDLSQPIEERYSFKYVTD